ncbi:class I SAM-dependent methyltransferase [Marivibrio halodurans]|uniref:Class I SAM-dependent methyltransferase n=1 Tax=Marivibrio halodurans TaxID=2039722 RepID=A0A8J7V0F8_9PROT|nr:class I SAM-dependent methyltransferase [Marivibrio halodurans]MBP5856756.1 class I SAM-dependent methyltransferase [Marivibrio halodurans]
MTKSSLGLDPALQSYLLSVSLRESDIQRRLREETAELPLRMMQIAPEQGQFMALMVELTGARRAIEIGTFTGYSALTTAMALPADGRLIACDVSEEWTAIGRRYWEEAGVADKIDLRIAPAMESLSALLEAGEQDSFDIAFIDADKTNYQAYYDACLELMRPGGLIMIDNVLWDGAVAYPEKKDKDTEAIRALNARLKEDERVSLSMVPIADGLTLCRKR